MAEQKTDQELLKEAEAMLRAGKSETEVKQYLEDEFHPIDARIAGAIEGAGSGLMSGILAVPRGIRDTLMDVISLIQGKSPENAKAFIEGLHDFLPKLQQAGPREQTRMMVDLLTSVGMGVGETAALTSKPALRTVGRGMEHVGEHPFAYRMASGAGVVGGVASGRPELVLGGVAGMMAPPILASTGKKLIRLGGGMTHEEQTLQNKFSDAMTHRQATAFDERASELASGEKQMRSELGTETKLMTAEQKTARAEQANADILSEIRRLREGQEAQPSTFSRSASAKDPVTGQTETVRTPFKPAEVPEAVLTPEQILMRDNPKLTPEAAKRIADHMTGQHLTPAPGARPPIQVDPASIQKLEGNSPRLGAAKIGEARLGEAPAPPPMAPAPPITQVAPRNLKMGSQDSVTDMVTEITNATKGGIQIDAPKGKGPLTFKDLSKRMTENEVAARAEVRGTPEDIPNNPAAQKLEAERQGLTPPSERVRTPEEWKEFVEQLPPNTDISAEMAIDEAERQLPPQELIQFESMVDRVQGKYDKGTPIKQAIESEMGVQNPEAPVVEAARQQATSPLEAAMIGRRMPMEEVPGSKSRRSTMSETNPKLTVDEEQAFGFPAGTKITALPEAVVEELLNRRRQRSESYRVNAGMDKGATRAYESDR